MSALVQAAKSGVERLGLPLLGAGAAGLEVAVVALGMLAALRQSLLARAAPGLRQVLLVAPDPDVGETLRSAWKALDQGVQLSMLADLPVDDPRLDLLGTSLASKVARAADRERPLWRRILDPLPTRLLTPDGRRKRYLATTLLSAAVGIAVLIGTGAFHSLTTGKVTASVLVTVVTAIVRQATTLRGTAADVGTLVRTPDATLPPTRRWARPPDAVMHAGAISRSTAATSVDPRG